MSTNDIRELERQLAVAKRKEREEYQASMFADVKKRCDDLVKQTYWEKGGYVNMMYNYTGFFSVYKIVSLTPGWWGTLKGDGMGNAYTSPDECSIKISGHVEHLLLPILPTLIKTQTINDLARGFTSDRPSHIALRVSKRTKKQAKGFVESWFNFEDNLVVPFTVTAAPTLSFHEEISFFDGLAPSTPERFENAVKLVLDFVRNTQAMFPENV